MRNHPATLAERNLFGHTPLHLAADKPACLQHLVKGAGAALLNQTDHPDGDFEMTPLETAVFISGSRCREGNLSHRKCLQCDCADCITILLEADCAVPVPTKLQHILRYASEQGKLRYAHGMRDRRDRLKRYALDTLPTTELERLGLMSERVLDSAAPRVIQLLKDRGSDIPEALAVERNGPSLVYQRLRVPSDAEVFFSVGFQDTDSWFDADAAELKNVPNLEQDLAYLHWLGTHGASTLELKSFDSKTRIFVANYTFWRIGEDLDHWSRSWIFNNVRFPFFSHSSSTDDSETPPLGDRIAWIHEINARVLPAEIADNCSCKCSPGGCTPLTSLLKGIRCLDSDYFGRRRRCSPERSVMEQTNSPEGSVTNDVKHTDPSENSVKDDADVSERSVAEDTEFSDVHSLLGHTGSLSDVAHQFSEYLELFGCDLEVKHYMAALRYMTFTSLGIPHSCCHPYRGDCKHEVAWTLEESEVEYEDEHAYELWLLEKLLEEFEQQLSGVLQDPGQGVDDVIRFWKHSWVRRMREVLDELKGNDLTEDEKCGAEKVGVVWDRPKPPKVKDNRHRKGTLEQWIYELERIEAEC